MYVLFMALLILRNLLYTVLIEWAVLLVFCLIRHDFNHAWFLDQLLINCFTNPLLNLIVLIFSIHSLPLILIMEAVVILIEGELLFRMSDLSRKETCLLSFCMNAASYLIGGFII